MIVSKQTDGLHLEELQQKFLLVDSHTDLVAQRHHRLIATRDDVAESEGTVSVTPREQKTGI